MSDFETVPVGTMERLAQVAAERDALAAHVAALVEWADAYVGTTGLYEEVESARNANTTSLARLKAEWQAEALQQLADDYYGEINPRTVANRAAELHRQAEGDK